MILSIITTIYRRPEEIDPFFERMYTQKNKNFELIVVVDTNVFGQMEKLQKWSKKFKNKMKIAYNTKRQGRTKSNLDGIKMASGEYTLFISTSDEIKRFEGVDEIITSLKKIGSPDILEFPATFRGVTRWNSDLRIKAPTMVEIEKKPIVIAKTMPFALNKIYKTELLVDAASQYAGAELNTRFSIELLYQFLNKHAKTFATVNKRIIKTYVAKESVSFNPMRLSRQLIKNIAQAEMVNSEYLQEITYATLYSVAIFLPIFTIAYKNNVMFNKLFEQISKMYDKDLKTVLITNKYLLKNDREAIWLSAKRTKTELKKSIKDFR
ncbi:glycosyltransferase [Mycoplasma todarodis]